MQKYKMPALSHVLQRYFGWGISTSGVEHGFAAQRRLLQHRGSASEETKLNWMVLSGALPAGDEVDFVITGAQEVWCKQGLRRLCRFC